MTVRIILLEFMKQTHLSNNLRRLRVVDGSEVLLHRCVIVTFVIKVVTILSVDNVLLCDVDASFLGEVNRQNV